MDNPVSVLSEIRAEYNLFDPEEELRYRALSMAIEALNGQRWIPCSKWLPEENSDWKNVTIIDESGDTSYIYTSVGFYLSDGCWIVDNEPILTHSSIRVLAWMSLPEPYREDGDDND